MKKKLLALLLAVLMMVSVLPVSAFAFSWGDYAAYRSSLLQSGKDFLQSLFFGQYELKQEEPAAEEPAEEALPAEETAEPKKASDDDDEDDGGEDDGGKDKDTHDLKVTKAGGTATKGVDYEWDDDELHILTGGLTVSGTTATETIVIPSDATVTDLTFSEVHIDHTSSGAVYVESGEDQAEPFTLYLASGTDNTLHAKYDTLFVEGPLTIDGSGSLTVKTAESGSYAGGYIALGVEGDFTLNGGTVALIAGENGVDSNDYACTSHALSVAGNVTLAGGSLTAMGGKVCASATSYGIYMDSFYVPEDEEGNYNVVSIKTLDEEELHMVDIEDLLKLTNEVTRVRGEEKVEVIGKLTVTGGSHTLKGYTAATNVAPDANVAKVSKNYDGSVDTTYVAANIATYKYLELGAAEAPAAHTHDGVTFTKSIATLSELNTLFENGGSGYLTADIVTDGILPVSSDTSLCLNGHALTLNRSIVVDATFTLYDCDERASETSFTHEGYVDETGLWYLSTGTSFGTRTDITGGLLTVNADYEVVNILSDGSFVLNGGTICGGSDGGVNVNSGGSFTMNGGKITGNTAANGGGVYNYGSFTMDGGTIANNTAALCGGGVYNYGSFTMDGGTIANNTAALGGGVLNFDIFTMSGNAVISGNTVDNDDGEPSGGGVYNYGSFTMTGGTITGNTAEMFAGGVHNSGNFTMTGGEITDNTAGMYAGGVFNMGPLTLGGTAKITDNTVGDAASNLLTMYLPQTFYVALATDTDHKPVSGEDGMEIGVAVMDFNNMELGVGAFTDATATETDVQFFTSDVDAYEVQYNAADGGYLELVENVIVTVSTGLAGMTHRVYVGSVAIGNEVTKEPGLVGGAQYKVASGSDVFVVFTAAQGYQFTDGKTESTVTYKGISKNETVIAPAIEKIETESTCLLTRLFNRAVKTVAAIQAVKAAAVAAAVTAPVTVPVAATVVAGIGTAMAVKLARSILFRPF